MVTKRHKTERAKKIAYWKTHIIAWRNTDLGATTYCRQHGLSVHKFKYWQYQLAKDGLSTQDSEQSVEVNPAEFVEVTQATPVSSVSALCDITTQHGFSITIGHGASSHDLQTILLALKALS